MERFLAKVEAGARWVQTQPVYDLEVLERFFARTRPPVPVVVGIFSGRLVRPLFLRRARVDAGPIPSLPCVRGIRADSPQPRRPASKFCS